MKKLISICLALFTLHLTSFAQCGINQKELRDKYCKGSYLVHSELTNSSPTVQIALKEGNKYAIYLLNPSHPVNRFTMLDSHNERVTLESRQNPDYTVYTFAPQTSDTYIFSVDFDTDKDACVLWTIYLQNSNNLKPGIYRSFEELKYNNPSVEFSYRITSRSRKINQDQVNFYSIDIDKRKAKEAGKVIGFSDGKEVYISRNSQSLRPGTEFVKAEILDRYYYFQDIETIIVPSGTTVVSVPKLVQKIMDMNTGKITTLNIQNLKELMADNPGLIAGFDRETQKNRKLKEYLIRYLDDKYNK
jgi:hypothetical protein